MWKKIGLVGCLVPMLAIMLFAAFVQYRLSDFALPPMLRGAQGGSLQQQSTRIDARIKELYPLDSEERELVSDLRSEGFDLTHFPELNPPMKRARISRFMWCGDKVWDIRWRAESGRITEISGDVGTICL